MSPRGAPQCGQPLEACLMTFKGFRRLRCGVLQASSLAFGATEGIWFAGAAPRPNNLALSVGPSGGRSRHVIRCCLQTVWTAKELQLWAGLDCVAQGASEEGLQASLHLAGCLPVSGGRS